MVNRDVISAIRLRICAIGVLKSSVQSVVNEPNASHFKIFGTGFLVGSLTVITNRHVIESITAYVEKESLPNDRRYVAFVRPDESGIAQSFHEIEKMGMATNPKHFDIGLVSFRATQDDPIHSLSPVSVSPDFSYDVGDPVGVYGYAFGENLLKREIGKIDRTYRFGPVLQQGWISAISPFEHAPFIDRVLLDVRTARGMSGSPVFNTMTGCVLAIHDAGMEDTVAFGIPISTQLISDLLEIHPSGTAGQHVGAQVSMVRISREDKEPHSIHSIGSDSIDSRHK